MSERSSRSRSRLVKSPGMASDNFLMPKPSRGRRQNVSQMSETEETPRTLINNVLGGMDSEVPVTRQHTRIKPTPSNSSRKRRRSSVANLVQKAAMNDMRQNAESEETPRTLIRNFLDTRSDVTPIVVTRSHTSGVPNVDVVQSKQVSNYNPELSKNESAHDESYLQDYIPPSQQDRDPSSQLGNRKMNFKTDRLKKAKFAGDSAPSENSEPAESSPQEAETSQYDGDASDNTSNSNGSINVDSFMKDYIRPSQEIQRSQGSQLGNRNLHLDPRRLQQAKFISSVKKRERQQLDRINRTANLETLQEFDAGVEEQERYDDDVDDAQSGSRGSHVAPSVSELDDNAQPLPDLSMHEVTLRHGAGYQRDAIVDADGRRSIANRSKFRTRDDQDSVVSTGNFSSLSNNRSGVYMKDMPGEDDNLSPKNTLGISRRSTNRVRDSDFDRTTNQSTISVSRVYESDADMSPRIEPKRSRKSLDFSEREARSRSLVAFENEDVVIPESQPESQERGWVDYPIIPETELSQRFSGGQEYDQERSGMSLHRKSSSQSHSNEGRHSNEIRHSNDGRHSNEGHYSNEGRQSIEGRFSNEGRHSYDGRHSNEGRRSNEGRYSNEGRQSIEGRHQEMSEGRDYADDGAMYDRERIEGNYGRKSTGRKISLHRGTDFEGEIVRENYSNDVRDEDIRDRRSVNVSRRSLRTSRGQENVEIDHGQDDDMDVNEHYEPERSLTNRLDRRSGRQSSMRDENYGDQSGRNDADTYSPRSGRKSNVSKSASMLHRLNSSPRGLENLDDIGRDIDGDYDAANDGRSMQDRRSMHARQSMQERHSMQDGRSMHEGFQDGRSMQAGLSMLDGRSFHDGRSMQDRPSMLDGRSFQDGRSMQARQSVYEGQSFQDGLNLQDGRSFQDGRSMQDGQSIQDGRRMQDGRNIQDGRSIQDGRRMQDGRSFQDERSMQDGRTMQNGRGQSFLDGRGIRSSGGLNMEDNYQPGDQGDYVEPNDHLQHIDGVDRSYRKSRQSVVQDERSRHSSTFAAGNDDDDDDDEGLDSEEIVERQVARMRGSVANVTGNASPKLTSFSAALSRMSGSFRQRPSVGLSDKPVSHVTPLNEVGSLSNASNIMPVEGGTGLPNQFLSQGSPMGHEIGDNFDPVRQGYGEEPAALSRSRIGANATVASPRSVATPSGQITNRSAAAASRRSSRSMVEEADFEPEVTRNRTPQSTRSTRSVRTPQSLMLGGDRLTPGSNSRASNLRSDSRSASRNVTPRLSTPRSRRTTPKSKKRTPLGSATNSPLVNAENIQSRQSIRPSNTPLASYQDGQSGIESLRTDVTPSGGPAAPVSSKSMASAGRQGSIQSYFSPLDSSRTENPQHVNLLQKLIGGSQRSRQVLHPQREKLLPLPKKARKRSPAKRIASKRVSSKEKEPRVPRAVTKSILTHFSKCRITRDSLEKVEEISDQYWKNLIEDLSALAGHAGRNTIWKEDVELLMRRQGFLARDQHINVLIEKYLPLEYRRELIPMALSGNVVVPKL